MNILFINKGDIGGGGEKLVWDLMDGLGQSGHKVNLFAQDKKSSSERVKIIPRSGWRFWLSHLLGTDFDFFKTDFILQSEEFQQADIVHINNIHSHYFNLKTLAKICQLKPVVWTFHDLWPVTSYCPHPIDKTIHDGFYFCPRFSTKSWFKKINQRYLIFRKKVLYKNIRFNIAAPSRYMLYMLVGTAVAKMPTSLIYNGIDTQNFKPQDKATMRQRLNLPLDKKIFLLVANKGMGNRSKGWGYFSELANHFSNNADILFLCIGGSDNKEHENIKFVNFIDDSAVLSCCYSAVDALIFSSLAESFGLVVVEAMSCGTPVIAFPVGIVTEIIEHKKNGYIASNQSVASLIDGVDFILSLSSVEIEAIGKINRDIVLNKFDNQIMVKAYQGLYERILDSDVDEHDA